jgi:hypothetical protein
LPPKPVSAHAAHRGTKANGIPITLLQRGKMGDGGVEGINFVY